MSFACKSEITVCCVGETTEYASFVNYIENDNEKQAVEYVYYGEYLSASRAFGRSVLLLNTVISNISFCVINDIEQLSFFHNNYIISETDSSLLKRLEREYLANKSYLFLKQLNIIKLVFDVRKKSVVLASLPLHIQIEHTTFCNARCIMCDHYIAHNRGSRHLRLSTVKTLESLFPYVSMIIMHGNGEPLINPDIFPILELYKKYHIGISLNTNLSYLPEDILSLLRDTCKSVHVSCDGTSRKQYEAIRQGLSYSGFIGNIKRLVSVCRKTEKVLEVVLMRQNIQDTKKFVQFAHNYGFTKVIFNALGCNKWIGNEGDGLHHCHSLAMYYCTLAKEEGKHLGVTVVTPFEFLPEGKKRIIENVRMIREAPSGLLDSQTLHNKYPWYTNTIAFKKLNMQSISMSDKTYNIRGICEYPFAKTYIDLCGNVSFCCPASRKIVDTISDKNKFKDIWNGRAYRRMREIYYRKGMPLLCIDCMFVKNRELNFLAIE